MKKPKKVKLDGDVEFTDGGPSDAPADNVLPPPSGRPQPPPEEDLGGGDICSPEPSTDDDLPPV